MDLNNLLKASIIFLIGFLIANLLSFYFVNGLENPLFKNLGLSTSVQKEAPFDFVKENQIAKAGKIEELLSQLKKDEK